MARLKLTIDTDVDFAVTAELEVFGYQAGVRVAVRKAGQRPCCEELPGADVIDLPDDQFEEVEQIGKEDDESA